MQLIPFKNKTGSRSSELEIFKDATKIKDILKKIREGIQAIQSSIAVTNSVLMPEDQRNIMGKILHIITPSFLYGKLPEPMLKIMAEHVDVLSYMETLFRTRVDNIQSYLKSLSIWAAATKKNIDELNNELKTAKKERWDAKKLQEMLAKRSEIEIYEEVENLLNNEFDILPLEAREQRKEALLEMIASNVAGLEKLMRLIAVVCIEGIQSFHVGVSELFNYIHVYKPIAAIRDAAIGISELSEVTIGAREVITHTLDKSLALLEMTVEGITLAQTHSIASPDMQQFIESGRVRLEKKMHAFLKPNTSVKQTSELKYIKKGGITRIPEILPNLK